MGIITPINIYNNPDFTMNTANIIANGTYVAKIGNYEYYCLVTSTAGSTLAAAGLVLTRNTASGYPSLCIASNKLKNSGTANDIGYNAASDWGYSHQELRFSEIGIDYLFYNFNKEGYVDYPDSNYWFDTYIHFMEAVNEYFSNPPVIGVPISYNAIGCSLSGPESASTGEQVSVLVTPEDNRIIRDPTQGKGISVYNKNGYIPFTYTDGTISFTVPS